jgi:hypothetical protein
VVILSEFALLGKSFFDTTQDASVERVDFRVDGFEITQQAQSAEIFADHTAKRFSAKAVAVFVMVADLQSQGGASVNERVTEFFFGDVHVVRIPQVPKNARNFLRFKKYFFVLGSHTWHAF